MTAEGQKVESRPAPRPVPLESFVSGIFWTLGATVAGLLLSKLFPRERVHVVIVQEGEEP